MKDHDVADMIKYILEPPNKLCRTPLGLGSHYVNYGVVMASVYKALRMILQYTHKHTTQHTLHSAQARLRRHMTKKKSWMASLQKVAIPLKK